MRVYKNAVGRPRKLTNTLKGGLASSESAVATEGSEAAESPTDDTRIIRMPRLQFLERRFAWEPAK